MLAFLAKNLEARQHLGLVDVGLTPELLALDIYALRTLVELDLNISYSLSWPSHQRHANTSVMSTCNGLRAVRGSKDTPSKLF